MITSAFNLLLMICFFNFSHKVLSKNYSCTTIGFRTEHVFNDHCVKSVRIRSYSIPYSVLMREMQTKITPNTDTFRAVDLYKTKFNSFSSFSAQCMNFCSMFKANFD